MGQGGGWGQYREFTFNVNGDAILSADGNKAREVAGCLNRNLSYRLAIDGARAGRVSNVREALIGAGVPTSKIQTRAFGDPEARRDSRLEVLIRN